MSLEPKDYKKIALEVKEMVAPNAEPSCVHCGLWKVKLMDGINEQFKCAIDYDHRYCQGKCSKYKEKKRLLSRLLRR